VFQLIDMQSIVIAYMLAQDCSYVALSMNPISLFISLKFMIHKSSFTRLQKVKLWILPHRSVRGVGV
jgi:hypothetical protein